MSTIPTNRSGWELRQEAAPSRCRHFTPIFGDHRMSSACWCRPFIQNEPFYTVVMHNQNRNDAPDNWPYAGQRP